MKSILSLVLVLAVVAACGPAAGPGQVPPTPTGTPIRIGAVFPLAGNAADLAGQQLAGIRIAFDMVNADGGIDGRPLVLDVRDLEAASDAPAVMAGLKAAGASVVVGAYSSDLSIAASAAADAAGLVYWEAGAVADRLTGRGLPLVFRVGASGTTLGQNSASFAAAELAPRLGKAASSLRLAIVAANDDYAASVAGAARATALAAGVPVVADATYDVFAPDWPALMSTLASAAPDVIILASHIPDGIAFRRQMLAAKLRVGALIGSTMAECDPDFAGELGADAIGIFASDRPTGGFQPSALDPAARVLYDRLAAAWVTAGPMASAGAGPSGTPGYDHGYGDAPGADATPEYAISGPVEEGSSAAGPTEEGLSGFSAGWVLGHYVLPAAAAAGQLDAQSIAAAARAVDLPAGALPNGAGVHFSTDPATMGQNERAVGVIWQWQSVRAYTFVWPSVYATGSIQDVPLTQ
jgi:ABC-type branched-subunit amino acid transport system substrate-binding protein